VQIVSAIAILWGFSGYFDPAKAHQPGDVAETDIVSANFHETSKSENAPDTQRKDHRHCASAGHMCHASAAIFNGLGQLMANNAKGLLERLIDRRSSRLFPPLHRPPIHAINARA